MIVVPDTGSVVVTKKMRDLIEFFNNLETQLAYPNCEGKTDAVRILRAAERELINQGTI